MLSYIALIALCLYQKQRACQASISLGQTVISKHKNLRYYSSKVTQITSQMFYEVMFDDGSFSNDTYPEDIVVRICLISGPAQEVASQLDEVISDIKTLSFERSFFFFKQDYWFSKLHEGLHIILFKCLTVKCVTMNLFCNCYEMTWMSDKGQSN